ncbi:MAG: UbiA family prenyltransferase [Candidatus Tectomicrobia bacterium]|uniref:4-hydroxybenzoate polyprenyltransferase n=1 Tax=Tectimicrobiota bacterium TaxID=2528274 RepID=A0A932HVX2_UNCTE|nr:UbiA family prenyltransferase [Candidatus Tectomicrobia bacterium]
MPASLGMFLRMVKFEHTVFGLPFVLMGGVLAAGGLPTARTLFWMVMAAAGARNFAMTLNRFADRDIDPKNPRTQDRAEFQGLLASGRVWGMMAAFLGLFLLSAWMLNPLAFALSFVVVGATVFYSYSKRFTSWTHLFLGFVLGCAPAGAWVAVRGELGWAPVLLFAGVTLWVGGFDIIYACLDVEFDKAEGLHSLPRRLGPGPALALSALAHAGTVACFAAAGWRLGLGLLYWLGLAGAAGLLAWEHWIVRPDDLRRVNLSFFNLNAWVSVIVSAGAILDVFLPVG